MADERINLPNYEGGVAGGQKATTTPAGAAARQIDLTSKQPRIGDARNIVKFTVTQTSDNITLSLERQLGSLRQILPKAYDYFVKKTPIDTGNARRNTYRTKNTIEADYKYAQPLDRGWSRQAPQGMTKPTIDYVKQLVRQMRRK